MNIARGFVPALAAVVVLGACANEDESGDADDAAPSGEAMMDMNGMPNMEGMAGMEGGPTGMMADMQAHMQMMSAMSGDSMHTMLARHRQMMANMIAEMNREMSEMNMQADGAWSATMDSLRTDLATMADVDPAELQALMPGHHRRAMRLMDMHREMMAGMQM